MNPTPEAPRISIITAVRNGMPFVSATLASVREQTWPHIEHIVIDGGSTDGTLDVLRANATRLSYWVSEPDAGISDAFNKGIARAGGDYLLFLNADDRLATADAVARMAADIVASGWPELIYGDCRLFVRGTDHLKCVTQVPFEVTAFRRGATLPHPSLFMHRSYFERFGLYDTGFRIAMDFELLLRGATEVRVVRIPRVVSDVNDGGISVRSDLLGIDEVVGAMRKNGIIGSNAGALAMRGYFRSRRALRLALTAAGVYPLLERWRAARSRRV